MRATVVDGAGYHAGTQREYGPAFAAALGYLPYPGSLNVDVDEPFVPTDAFGPSPIRISATRTFAAWPIVLAGYDGPAHLLLWRDPDVAQHQFEIVAPDRLRPIVGTSVEIVGVYPEIIT